MRLVASMTRRAAAGLQLTLLLAGRTAAAQAPAPEPTTPEPRVAPSTYAPTDARLAPASAPDVASATGGGDTSDAQTVQVSPSKEGFGFQTKDGAHALKVRGLAQADGRAFVQGGTNSFLLRRVRPTFDATVYKHVDIRVTAELSTSPSVLDAYVNLRLLQEVQLRVGKFKSPLGLERLQSDPDMPFMERGLPSYLVSDRDTGAQLHGEIGKSTIAFALAYFNGAADSAHADTDNNDKKDLVGRLFVRPFAATAVALLRNLGVGFAASRGTQIGALPRYVSPDQAAFFSYGASAQAAGTHRRIAPQAYFYLGPVGLLAEWTRSSQIVTNGVRTELLNHSAWQVQLSGFVTGEQASFSTVTPKNQLDPQRNRWGALELAARMGAVAIDELAFAAGFADPNSSARSAREWALATNWYVARGCRVSVNYERTRFDGGTRGGDRPEQIAVFSRLQGVF